MVKCKRCGKDINDSAKFCPYCGTPTATSISPKNGLNQNRGYKNSSDSSKKNLVILGVVVLVAIIGFFMFRGTPSTFNKGITNGSSKQSNSASKSNTDRKGNFNILDYTVSVPSKDVPADKPLGKNEARNIVNLLSGNWYDTDGHLVLTIDSGAINNYSINTMYNFTGALNMGGGTLIFNVNNDARYMRVFWSVWDKASKHSTLLIGNKKFLYKKDDEWRYESVNGVSLGMSREQVKQKLGDPSKISNNTWTYDKEGIEIYFGTVIGGEFNVNRVDSIKLLKSGTAHFDKSGLKASSLIQDYAKAYNMNKIPQLYSIEGIGRGEYLLFESNYICFNTVPLL
jgi:ribosomal protein L37E